MIGFKGHEKRTFKYYPRFHRDPEQEKQSPFATSYLEKKLDQQLLADSQKTGRKHKFRRRINTREQKTFIRKMRVNFILFIFILIFGYAIHWVATNTQALADFWERWGM